MTPHGPHGPRPTRDPRNEREAHAALVRTPCVRSPAPAPDRVPTHWIMRGIFAILAGLWIGVILGLAWRMFCP